MVTWVLYLCIGIVVGGMAGFYFAKLDDFSKKQKRELEEKLRHSEQELIGYKDQVTTHFRETATLINTMTESYQKVHEHLARGSVELCNNAIEVNKLEVSPDQLLTDSAQENPAEAKHIGADTGMDSAAETASTEKAESEAPKDTHNNKNKSEEVDVPVSAARATDEVVEDEYSETGADTVTVPASERENRPSQTVATSPDTSTGKASVKPTDLPPTVTETMAVAEELDESSAETTVSGSRTVH